MTCPNCGYDLSRPAKLPKRIRLHDCKSLTDKYQVVEAVTEINPPDRTRTNKYSTLGKVSRIMVYQIVEDK